jgi:hypothetical protein
LNIAIQIEPPQGELCPVEYRWDADTDILSAGLTGAVPGEGMSGTVELTGDDGAWLNLEVTAGTICGIEVAVWPEVKTVPGLAPSNGSEPARVVLPCLRSERGMSSLEIETALRAAADPAEQTIHFTFGSARPARTLSIARDLLLEVDAKRRIAGIWLLNVPPFPGSP